MKQQVMSLQFALFFSEQIVRPYQVFEDINRNMMNIFDALPQTMDLPPMLPADVPLVTYRSENQEYICTISRSRIDLHIQRANNDQSNSQILQDFNIKTEFFVKYVLGKTSVNRFGMICRYFFPFEDPIKVIGERYIKSPLDGLSELTIHLNKPSTFGDYLINDIADISAAEAVIENKTHKGVFVQRDLNNQPNEKSTLDIKKLSEISKEFSPRVTESGVEELLK